MAGPNTGMKISKKDGVIFQSNVDHVMYTIEELIHAANRDVGKFVSKETANEIYKAYSNEYVKGEQSAPRQEKFKKTYANKTVQYWARKKELDVVIGFKNFNWMTQQELGEYHYPRLGLLTNTVQKNISMINRIQAQYLTALREDKPSIPSGPSGLDEGDGE